MEDLRQKARLSGLKSLTLQELLALVLHNRQTPTDASLNLANLLLSHFENLEQIAQTSPDILATLPGMSPILVYRLLGALELGHQLQTNTQQERPLIRRPSDAVRLLERHMSSLNQEQLRVILLDVHNRVMEIETIYIGSLNTTVVRIAEVFRPAITHNSAGIIIAHNHPSGNTTPSDEDIQLTIQLVEAGKMLDIAVVDHLIIGNAEWISLREAGKGF